MANVRALSVVPNTRPEVYLLRVSLTDVDILPIVAWEIELLERDGREWPFVSPITLDPPSEIAVDFIVTHGKWRHDDLVAASQMEAIEAAHEWLREK